MHLNKGQVIIGTIVADEGSHCQFRPWAHETRDYLGYKATELSGRVTYIYILPDIHTKPGSKPTFSLYIGTTGDPEQDRRLGPYTVEEDQ